MNLNKILIDSIYCHQGGGKTILDLIIDEIIKQNKLSIFFFLLDHRYENKRLTKNFFKCKDSEISRRNFYKKHSNFDKLLCLGNVPPPIKTTKPTYIYFQNNLLIDPKNSNLNFFEILKLNLKKNYINYRKENHYKWVVQTQLMKKNLERYYRVKKNNILVYPIFETKKVEKSKSKSLKYLYVGDNKTHKNLSVLLEGFKLAASKIDKKIELHLTIEKLKDIKDYPTNLKIFFHGVLEKKQVEKLFDRCYFFVYPSLIESFGLPLIEATNHGLRLITADLDYVYQVVYPSLSFNPSDSLDLSEKIIKSTKNKLKNSQLIIENKLQYLITSIINV